MGRCDVGGNDDKETMVVTIADRYFCHATCAQMAGVPERKVNA